MLDALGSYMMGGFVRLIVLLTKRIGYGRWIVGAMDIGALSQGYEYTDMGNRYYINTTYCMIILCTYMSKIHFVLFHKTVLVCLFRSRIATYVYVHLQTVK